MYRGRIIEEEEKYLDKVLGAIDDKIRNVKEDERKLKEEIEAIGIPDKEDASTLRKKKKMYYECTGKIVKLSESKKRTHFGRMDLKLKEKDTKEDLTMYIGEKSISDTNLKQLVYDWRSPLANLYYMTNQTTFNYNETSYDLLLKRNIEIENSKLIGCQDLYSKGQTIEVTDNFLLKILEQKKDRSEFADIIRTIQSHQNSIIRDDPSYSSIVQGVAGSGKTVVLLHKISYMLYNNPNIKDSDIMFITPSEIFKSKLYSINRSLSLNNVSMITMEEYYLNKIKLLIPNIEIKNVTNDIEIDKNLLKYVYGNEFNLDFENNIKNYFNNFIEQVNKLNLKFDINKPYESINNIVILSKKALDNETWDTFEQRDEYSDVLNKARELLKKDNVKRFSTLLYNKLKEKYKLRRASFITEKQINKYMAYILLKVYYRYGFNVSNQYRYIFIDEMQDYSNDEVSNIINIEKNPIMHLYGDINQNINSYINKKSIIELKELLSNAKKTSNINTYELKDNYRNSKQITEYCNKFIENKMIPMGISSDEVTERNISTNDIMTEISSNFNSKENIVLCNNMNITNQLMNMGYEVYTVKNAKGLEFSNVVVINDNLNVIEKYIGFTRTLNKLFVYNLI